MRRFEGRVAFISGAGSGIGLAAAQRIAEEGGRVVCGVETEAQRAATGDLTSIVIDVAEEESWRAAIAQTVAEHGGLDVLVCSAGILRKGTAEETSLELWNQVLAVNLNGVFLGARYGIPEMRKRGGGAIVNISSLNGIRGTPGALAYAASKGGVVAITMSMALDHAHENIRVNCICPGVIKTRLSEALWAEPEVEKAMAAQKALKRVGTTDELVGAAIYLASPASSFTTGAMLQVDGGMVI